MDIQTLDYNTSIVINKKNYIIYNKYENIIKFYKLFYDLINKKDETIKIMLNNNKVTSKDYTLYNFIDINNIINTFIFEKGTIIYDYFITLVENNNIELLDKINEQTKLYFDSMKELSVFDYSVNTDINPTKLLQTGIQINTNINFEEYSKLLQKMLKYLLDQNPTKYYIIFYNSDYIDFNDIYSYENIYFFDISKKYKINNYNILLLDEVHNLNYQNIIDKLELCWPIEYKAGHIKYLLDNVLMGYFTFINPKANNEDLAILYFLLNKYFNLSIKLDIDYSSLNKNIQDFLQS